jgi:subtilase family serine protease
LRPDLVAQGLELSLDRIAIVRVANVGASPYSGTITVRIVFNGETIEELQFSGSLAVQGSLTLSGSRPIEGEGQLSAIVDPANQIAESNEGNNAVAIVVTP